ncbi:Thiol:disulfide interchange protein DsbD [Candidatus Methylobacter favarea]|uniref:Thiol:disulfide interchange protein DsbD n=1 Tax=Candidatus Methylobacter favarea TaxID=2707345 RepID=A0A8S0XRX5_9GAMM|nr:protein-disulfide reductase DsbD [Candidatus Methylobacter favarea]CAA9890329.1 Thiol:disulfide interchange protein DsbD [Candidatus Methylobacter favarea]
MPFFKITFFCLLAFFISLPAFALASDNLLPPQQAFKISAKALAADQIEVSWDIAEGYMLYLNNMRFESKTDLVKLAEPVFPEGEISHNEILGDVVHYRKHLQVPIKLLAANEAASMQLRVQYQGCADRGVCYTPQKATLDITLPAAASTVKAEPVNPLVKGISALKLNLFEDELLPPDQAFQFLPSLKDANTLHVNWQIAEGYYLYREKIRIELVNAAGVRLGTYSIPRGVPKHDEAFGQVETFHNELSFDLPVIRSTTSAQTITLQAKYQGCADRGVCYPPMSKKFDLVLPVVQQELTALAAPQPAPALSEQDQIVQSLQQGSALMTLLSFFGFGLLLAFTPCIFPMIPILSGIIVGHGNRIGTARAFFLSLSYVIASAATYTVFGILAALFGNNLQSTFQQPWIIALFSAIFVLLSFSMFGFYHLELPKSLQAKLHNSSERHRDGSLWGAAIMGSLSSLIVGPCVAAPLAGALIYIGQSGDAVLGGSALFMMGLGMGVPLLLLGASAGKLLPKAGDWLNATKAVFGVIMLAVAVWMLSRILPPDIIMMLWAMLLIFPAIYLSAIDPLRENSSGWRKLWKGVGVMMLGYGLLLLIGFSMGNSNPLKPLQGLTLTNTQAAAEQGISFEKITSLAELEARIQQATANHQRVMLDFYADWCISCKEMENYTFTNPEVKQALQDFVLLQADVTENSENDKALLAKFGLIGPPGVLFFGADNQEHRSLRVIGYQDAGAFIKTVQQARL